MSVVVPPVAPAEAAPETASVAEAAVAHCFAHHPVHRVAFAAPMPVHSMSHI
jgi:hypothetical protein